METDSKLFKLEHPKDTRPNLFRPIHYLGSKLRILQYLTKTISAFEPSQGSICDLFSGSGSVSFALSASRNVHAVDIQEYSRVICSAILKPPKDAVDIQDLALASSRSSAANVLKWTAAPLIEYERKCVEKSLVGDSEALSELLENGSVISFQLGDAPTLSQPLRNSLQASLDRMITSGLSQSERILTFRYFGGLYFSYAQAIDVDILLDLVHNAPRGLRDRFLAALLSTASDIVNTVGKQFAQPLKPRRADGTPKPNLSRRVMADRGIDVTDLYISWFRKYAQIQQEGRQHEVYRMDYCDFLKGPPTDLKLVYADPPYTRDHYSRYYHVLETLTLRDNPNVSFVRANGISRVSRGVYRTDRYQSPFCIKSKVTAAFVELFSRVRSLGIPLLLSYSPYDSSTKARPRLLSTDQIASLARAYFPHVDIFSPGEFAHSKLNKTELNFDTRTSDAELLFSCC